jgi:hypothetical protein
MNGDASPTQPSMIITDDVAPSPKLGFDAYSDTIVKIITKSHPKFSIGIYGEWGTGKTTLMKVVENKLNSIGEEYVLVWDELLQKNGEFNKFKTFLKDKYKVANWIDNSEFKSENGRTLSLNDTNKTRITDYRGTWVDKSNHSLILQLNDKKDTASMTMDGDLIRDFVVKKESKNLKLYLQRNEILTVWFNAWRYEREDQFAIIALVKTIGFAMSKHPIYKELKPILLNAVKIIGKGFLSEIAAKYIGEKGVEEFKTQLLPKMEFLSELDKDTIYFDAINRVENEMRKILDENPSTRVVVFIDDLDRCSPTKALEVFESIKVFLGLDGFVYVVGLSHLTIAKLITAAYEKSEVKGEDYIKKIIQIPIILPEWKPKDVGELIKDLKQNLIDKDHRDIIEGNIELISEVVEHNPREIKRFINNFIVAYDIHSKLKGLDAKQLLLVQALGVRWSSFYRTLVRSTREFRVEVANYAEMSDDYRIEQLESDKIGDGFTKQTKITLQEFKVENELWRFLKQYKQNILEVEDLQNYIEAAESVKEIPPSPSTDISSLTRVLSKYFTTKKDLRFLIGRLQAYTGLVDLRADSVEIGSDDIEEMLFNIVQYCSSRDRIPQLLEVAVVERPSVDEIIDLRNKYGRDRRDQIER